jgi:ApbE superfamily uncharacterized protein (UPF0280 family)
VQSFIAKYREHFQRYIDKNPEHATARDLVTQRPGAFW